MARSRRILLGILLGTGLLLVPVAGAPFAAAGNPCFHGYDVPPLSVGPVKITGSDLFSTVLPLVGTGLRR